MALYTSYLFLECDKIMNLDSKTLPALLALASSYENTTYTSHCSRLWLAQVMSEIDLSSDGLRASVSTVQRLA